MGNPFIGFEYIRDRSGCAGPGAPGAAGRSAHHGRGCRSSETSALRVLHVGSADARAMATWQRGIADESVADGAEGQGGQERPRVGTASGTRCRTHPEQDTVASTVPAPSWPDARRCWPTDHATCRQTLPDSSGRHWPATQETGRPPPRSPPSVDRRRTLRRSCAFRPYRRHDPRHPDRNRLPRVQPVGMVQMTTSVLAGSTVAPRRHSLLGKRLLPPGWRVSAARIARSATSRGPSG